MLSGTLTQSDLGTQEAPHQEEGSKQKSTEELCVLALYYVEGGFSHLHSLMTEQAQRGENKLPEVTSSFSRSGNVNSTCWFLSFPLAEAWHCDPEGGFAMDVITDAPRGCKSPQGQP